MATLPGAWHYRVIAGTGWPSVSILWLGEVESLICNFYLSVAAHEIVQIHFWDTLACCWDVKQPTNNHIIIIIIIAFKGAIWDFLQSPDSAANCLQHIRSSGPGAAMCKSRATHRALITCKSPATCHLVRRDSSAIKFDRVEITFIWALFYWLNH